MSNYTTPQETFWAETIGQAYMDHNKFEPSIRRSVRKEFYDLFEDLDKNSKVLEIGCNLGTNLAILHNMGFNNLNGVEIFKGAAEEAKKNVPSANITLGTALNLPYKNEEFDIVFTSGVLIHQHPSKGGLQQFIGEMVRVSNKFIIGLEDYHSTFLPTSVYRGEKERHWRGPYADAIKISFPDLKLTHKSRMDHWNNFPREQYIFEK